jgi:hypothetical protein
MLKIIHSDPLCQGGPSCVCDFDVTLPSIFHDFTWTIRRDRSGNLLTTPEMLLDLAKELDHVCYVSPSGLRPKTHAYTPFRSTPDNYHSDTGPDANATAPPTFPSVRAVLPPECFPSLSPCSTLNCQETEKLSKIGSRTLGVNTTGLEFLSDYDICTAPAPDRVVSTAYSSVLVSTCRAPYHCYLPASFTAPHFKITQVQQRLPSVYLKANVFEAAIRLTFPSSVDPAKLTITPQENRSGILKPLHCPQKSSIITDRGGHHLLSYTVKDDYSITRNRFDVHRSPTHPGLPQRLHSWKISADIPQNTVFRLELLFTVEHTCPRSHPRHPAYLSDSRTIGLKATSEPYIPRLDSNRALSTTNRL